MNRKSLILTSTRTMSREKWLKFRQPINHVIPFLQQHNVENYQEAEEFFLSDIWDKFIFPCVGGSECGTVLGLNPYTASIEIFYSKVGIKPFEDFDNKAMFWGRELEAQIANKWQYWDGSEEGMMDNFKKKNIVRKCRKVNAYVQNSKFPWIFVSLDRLIPKMEINKRATAGVLECKTMNNWVAKMWENGLPPEYVVQAQTQMSVCEVEYGEIAYLKDGRDFDVLPFDYNANIAEAVIRRTKEFFESVKKGISEYALYTLTEDEGLQAQHLHNIDLLAPEPDGSEGYKNYLSATHKDSSFGKPGGAEQFKLAMQYDDAKKDIELKEVKKTEAANKLKAFMGEANTIDFGDAGKVTWKENARGTRVFGVSIKRDNRRAYEDTKELVGVYEN